MRGPLCLAAEAEYNMLDEMAKSANDCTKCTCIDKQSLARLVEAGNAKSPATAQIADEWQAALAALKGER